MRLPCPLTFFTMLRRPQPVSRHKNLLPFTEPRNAIGPPHAVVLVKTRGTGGVLYLDPYYPSAGQPFTLTDDALAEAWTGQLVICPVGA